MVCFPLENEGKGEGGGEGGGGWGGDRQRNRQLNAQALSKLPFSDLPLKKCPIRQPYSVLLIRTDSLLFFLQNSIFRDRVIVIYYRCSDLPWL